MKGNRPGSLYTPRRICSGGKPESEVLRIRTACLSRKFSGECAGCQCAVAFLTRLTCLFEWLRIRIHWILHSRTSLRLLVCATVQHVTALCSLGELVCFQKIALARVSNTAAVNWILFQMTCFARQTRSRSMPHAPLRFKISRLQVPR